MIIKVRGTDEQGKKQILGTYEFDLAPHVGKGKVSKQNQFVATKNSLIPGFVLKFDLTIGNEGEVAGRSSLEVPE